MNTEPTEQLQKPIYERFCQAYVNETNGNAAEAYKLAGFKPDSANKSASRLLKRPEIRARIDCLIREKTGRLQLDYFQELSRNIESLKAIRDGINVKNADRIRAIQAINVMLGFNAPEAFTAEVTDKRAVLKINVMDQETADLLKMLD